MQGRQGAGPGISQPRSYGGRHFHPGPRRGPGRECCSCRQEGTGMGDNGSVADMALGCSVGSQEFSFRCHFRLRQAGELRKNQAQAEGKAPLDRPQPPGTTSRKICSHTGTMHGAFHPLGFVAGSIMHVASPPGLGLCRGVSCMLQGWDIPALLYHPLSSTLGQHFLRLGSGIANVLQLHSAGLVSPLVWGSSRNGVPLHAETESVWLCSFSASSMDCGGMTRTH